MVHLEKDQTLSRNVLRSPRALVIKFLRFRMEAGVHQALTLKALTTSTESLKAVEVMAKEDRGPIRFTLLKVCAFLNEYVRTLCITYITF